MNVIFLDVDGVLNNAKTFYKRYLNYLITGKQNLEIDEKMVERLKKIVDATSAKIVLSSSWRVFFTKHNNEVFADSKGYQLCEILEKYNMEIFDLTPYDKNRHRGNEISAYLNENEVDKYIIIDDDDFDLQDLSEHVIKTSFKSGLTDEHVIDAIEKLNSNVLKKC